MPQLIAGAINSDTGGYQAPGTDPPGGLASVRRTDSPGRTPSRSGLARRSYLMLLW